jgi:hypothetical protein
MLPAKVVMDYDFGTVLQLLDRSESTAREALANVEEVAVRASLISKEIRDRSGRLRKASDHMLDQLSEVVRIEGQRASQRPPAE